MTTLSLSQLETHLWRVADILRGSIDSGGINHIFGLRCARSIPHSKPSLGGMTKTMHEMLEQNVRLLVQVGFIVFRGR
jgi:hypothetical protein